MFIIKYNLGNSKLQIGYTLFFCLNLSKFVYYKKNLNKYIGKGKYKYKHTVLLCTNTLST